MMQRGRLHQRRTAGEARPVDVEWTSAVDHDGVGLVAGFGDQRVAAAVLAGIDDHVEEAQPIAQDCVLNRD
jgi:hypothetical protein